MVCVCHQGCVEVREPRQLLITAQIQTYVTIPMLTTIPIQTYVTMLTMDLSFVNTFGSYNFLENLANRLTVN